MPTDAQSGYVEPAPPNKYLDSEETGRTVGGVTVLRQRTADPLTHTKLDSVIAAVDGLEGFVDGLEALLTTLTGKDYATQTTLGTRASEVTLAALKARADLLASETTLAAVKTSVDTAETNRNADDDALRGLVATEATVARKFALGTKTTRGSRVSTSGDSNLIVPAAGKKVRLIWLGMSSSENNGAEALVLVKFGANVVYRWNMGTPGAFSHWEVVEGAVDQALVVNLSAAQPIDFNYTWEEV